MSVFFFSTQTKRFYKQVSLKVDGKGCSIEDETTKAATEVQQASTDATKCMGCINGHQAKTKETSSESSKDIQGSPCSSCGDSCSKCPDCCSYNAENKNPEAIITSTTGKKLPEKKSYRGSLEQNKNMYCDHKPQLKS